jgi:thioredoxin-related protein
MLLCTVEKNMHPLQMRFAQAGFRALLVLGLTAAVSLPVAWAGDSISWSKEVDKSLESAKHDQKYVLADVYTDWCHWCKKLDQDTFSDSNMVNYLNGKFICIKVNAEDHGEGTKIAKKYRVSGFPCALVFDQSGKFIGKISGYYPPADYQKAVTALVESPPADPYQ